MNRESDKRGGDNVNPADALRETIERAELKVHPEENPVGYVQNLYSAWKVRGGKISGKPRHSDRYLNDLLARQGTPVRSLVPKLRGKTRLQPLDAEALVKVLLTHWDVIDGVTVQGGMLPDYSPMLSSDRVIDVTAFVTEKIEREVSKRQTTSKRGPPLPVGQEHGQLIREQFRDADALMTVSSQQTLITIYPRRALIGFRNLMTDLWKYDREQPARQRLLIWVLDLGQRSFNDVESRLRFLNVWALIGRFKSLELFDDEDADERWHWLRTRAVIVMRDIRRTNSTNLGDLNLEGQHFLPRAIPEGWISSRELRQLYGENLERIDDRNYSFFFRQGGWNTEFDLNSDLRYFGATPLLEVASSDAIRQAHALELPSPGDLYDTAFRMVYTAAVQKLNLDKPIPVDSFTAEGQLAARGFRVLSLDEFMKL